MGLYGGRLKCFNSNSKESMSGRNNICAGISEPWLQERFADEIWAFDMFWEK